MGAMALPKTIAAVAASCFRPSLSTIYKHHLLHYPPHLSFNNVSSTFKLFQTSVTNLSEATCLEENGSSRVVGDVISSPNLVALEYADLNLPLNCEVYLLFFHIINISLVISCKYVIIGFFVALNPHVK